MTSDCQLVCSAPARGEVTEEEVDVIALYCSLLSGDDNPEAATSHLLCIQCLVYTGCFFWLGEVAAVATLSASVPQPRAGHSSFPSDTCLLALIVCDLDRADA